MLLMIFFIKWFVTILYYIKKKQNKILFLFALKFIFLYLFHFHFFLLLFLFVIVLSSYLKCLFLTHLRNHHFSMFCYLLILLLFLSLLLIYLHHFAPLIKLDQIFQNFHKNHLFIFCTPKVRINMKWGKLSHLFHAGKRSSASIKYSNKLSALQHW